jgi:hypothetical protein|tara:strand:- start:3914 stop:4066 length:153 start_codon:yes stop_codon:yes gene_type:complete
VTCRGQFEKLVDPNSYLPEPETVTEAPFIQPVRRLDEVKAAKELDLVWSE